MYTQISDEMKKMLEADARTFLMKLQSDTFEITSGFRKIVYQGGSSGEGLAIGTTVSASVEITMEKTEHLLTGKEFAFYLGMNVDGKEEYIPMGIFKAQKPAATDWEITLKAYDRMYDAERNYASSLHYPTDTQKVMREIEKLLGISFVTEITPVSLKKTGDSDVPFAGYTIREAIGYVAGLYGKFAIFNRAGQLEFRWYESGISIPLKKMFSFERNEQDYEVQKVVGSSDSNTSYTAGSGNHGISYSNPFLTKEIVNQIYSSKHGFSYRGGTVTFLGDCRIDPWDMLQVTDLQGNIYKIPAMQITHEIDGGLTTTITAEAEEEDVEDSFSGPATKAMERTFAELLLVNKLVATKASIEYLEANYIKTSELDAVQANIETAVITNLQGKFATIEYIKANYATIGNLSAANAKIDTLEATALTASSAEIVALKTGIADINTLMFGSASGGSITTEFSNSIVANIGDAQIKSAMIKDISADKLTSGKIYTNQVEIVSRTGNLDIADNTIQIKDGKKVVRVQIGKDASGDYNIYIWDKNGKLMFDPLYGVQEDGIKKAIIRNDMISDTANISGKKIDIASLITTINEDGSSTLKASKIYVDTDKQTLDVSFENLTGSVNSATNTASAALSKVNTVEANLKTISDKVTTQGTQLTTVQGQISSKVWQQDITTAVTNLQVGGRNLIVGTSSANANSGWSQNGWPGSFTTYNSKERTYKLVANSGWHVARYTSLPDYIGKQVTISFKAKNVKDETTATSTWALFITNKTGSNPYATSYLTGGTPKQDYWHEIKFTVTLNTDGRIGIGSTCQPEGKSLKSTWLIKDLKLELGNKATDWTPAPEDTDSSILGLEATTKTLSTQYTSLNQTLTSLTATVNSNTTAISKKADGSIVTDLQANMTSLTADLNGFKTTVSSTYSTKTELNKASGIVKATYNAGSNTSAYCHLAEIKIKGTYANNPITICIHSRNNGESTVYIRFVNSGGTDPALHSIGKTGANSVYIGKTGTSTWQLYIGTSAWDVIEVIDIYSTTHFAIIWKTAGVATCPSGTVAAFQMAAMGEVDYTSGGTSGSNKIPTSGSLYSTTTIANQTADKFQWIVKSGTSATDFTITDRMASLTAQYINLNGLVTFTGLNKNVQETLNSASKNYPFRNSKAAAYSWVKIGTLTSAGDASVANINIQTGTGYNASASQNSGIDITIKDGYQSTKSTTAAFGVSVIRHNCTNKIQIQVRATAYNKCEIWLYTDTWAYWSGVYTISGRWDGWEPGVDSNGYYTSTTSSAPTTGTLQNTEYRADGQTANSKAQGIIDNIYTTNTTTINGGKITTGTITADKINVDSLQAISAKIGGWKINSTSLYTDIVASDGYLRRGYLQTPFKTNPEETWIFSVQKGAAKGETPTTLNGLWYVDGNGNNYMQNLTIAGKILKDVTSDGSVTVNGSQLNAMQNLCIGASSMWTGYSVHCHGNAFIDGKNYVNGDVVCKNMILGLGASTATYITADAYGSTNFIVNSSIRHVIGQSEDTFYNKSHFAGSQYPHIYGNGTYLILGYGNSQSLQLDNSKRFMPVADNSYTLGYSGYRWKQVYAAAGSISTSDRNSKKDITELDNQSYDFVMGLKPSKYRFIENESNRIHYGLIAQDVEILLGKLGIKTDDFAGFVKSQKIKVDEQTRKETIIDGEYEYGLRYEEFIAPIIKTIQMQDKKLKNLDNMVTHLIGIAMHPEKIDYNNN